LDSISTLREELTAAFAWSSGNPVGTDDSPQLRGNAQPKNEPVPGSTPAGILLRGQNQSELDKPMDGKKLAAGNYIMSVVNEGKTASIFITIK